MRYIDVSEHQGEINWDMVKASGSISGVIIRAGYGRNNIDKQFKRNIEACNRLGIPCGVYWFSYAYTPEMAVREAEYCLAAIEPYRVELPVVFDFEYDSIAYMKRLDVKPTRELCTEIANAFLYRAEQAEYYAMLYSSPDFMASYFDMTKLSAYDLCLAWYTTKDHYVRSYNPGIWQYASNGKVQGIEGDVDMNEAFVDYRFVVAEAGLNRLLEVDKAEPAAPWYAEYQRWAKEHGIADGTRPEEPATRAEVWAMLKRFKDGESP